MDALIASYGDSDTDSDSDSDSSTPDSMTHHQNPLPMPSPLPPPPVSLLTPPNSLFGTIDETIEGSSSSNSNRIRSLPHVQGSYALHVYIPVYVPQSARKEAAQFLKKVSSNVPGLHVVDAYIPIEKLLNDDQKLESIALRREFHISLGRTVPISVLQMDSMITMLRQKLQFLKRLVFVHFSMDSMHSTMKLGLRIFVYVRYWIDFNKWEVFVNDDHTRAFISLEVTTGGLLEITKQIQAVNEVYRLHNLPEFYKDPRPHISLAWALGDSSDLLRSVLEETKKQPNVGPLQKRIFTVQFGGIECKIGQKTYKICKIPAE